MTAARSQIHPVNGVLVVDKPADCTSFDVVARIKRLFRMRKIGHTGTLDPFATGALVICLGEATKLVPWLQGDTKQYTGTMELGTATNTLDFTGTITETVSNPVLPSRDQLEEAAATLTGPIEQMPPIFSAVKFQGKRLYKEARAGKPMPEGVPPRPVIIHKLTVNQIQDTRVEFTVVCSPGTYVRSLARDWGEKVGLPAHLTGLRRDWNGNFSGDLGFPGELLFQREDTHPKIPHERLITMLGSRIMGMGEAAAQILPSGTVSPQDEERLRVGKAIYRRGIVKWEAPTGGPTPAPWFHPAPLSPAPGKSQGAAPGPETPAQYALLSLDGSLIAIGNQMEENLLKPVRGFNTT